MRRLAKRIVRKCRREVLKRFVVSGKQKSLLDKIIHSLETNKISDDLSSDPALQLLDEVYNATILEKISMADMPFIVYLLYLKYRGEISLLPLAEDFAIEVGGKRIANMSNLAVYMHFLDIKDGELCVEGNVSIPTVFKEIVEFRAKLNGEEIPANMYEANLDLKKGENVYETRTAYRIKVPLDKDKNQIKFYNSIEGNDCAYGRINSMRFSPVADCIKSQYCVRDGWIVYIEGNSIIIERATKEKTKEREKAFQTQLKSYNKDKAQWAINLRNEYFEEISEKKRPIWLFMDRIDRAGDNAEVLFKYARRRDEVDAYFIIEEGTRDYERLYPLGNIIRLNSREHHKLVLMADYIISSQCNGVVENPFWGDAEFFRDLYHQGKIIFLQHGVIKDDMSCTLNRFHTHFAGFITSGVAEAESIIDSSYLYDKEQVWLTGLPRFDLLYDNRQKYILIMPSWRQGLMEQVWDEEQNSMIWKVKDNFTESEYVKRYRSLLENEELKGVCQEYGYKMVFMPHALMEPYINEFSQSEHCIYWDREKLYTDAFAEGNLMITDYSSVAFDFAYLNKPVIYYQFDREQFYAEHTYDKGYYDYCKDGFGEVVDNEKDIIKLIIEYIESECKLKEIYIKRINEFFKYQDRDCCKRVYEKIHNNI